MGHCISGLIGHEATFRALEPIAISREPRAALADGWAFVPLDAENLDGLVGPDLPDAFEGFEYLGPKLLEALRVWSEAGDLAYVETEYFGGIGAQGAVAASGGRLIFGPQWAPVGAINAALATLGVAAPQPDMDAFDALGLGRHRSNKDFTCRTTR